MKGLAVDLNNQEKLPNSIDYLQIYHFSKLMKNKKIIVSFIYHDLKSQILK